jgi:hypothetical protein
VSTLCFRQWGGGGVEFRSVAMSRMGPYISWISVSLWETRGILLLRGYHPNVPVKSFMQLSIIQFLYHDIIDQLWIIKSHYIDWILKGCSSLRTENCGFWCSNCPCALTYHHAMKEYWGSGKYSSTHSSPH